MADKSNKWVKTAELTIIILFFALYVWNISHYFWTLPIPSDPLQYLGPMAWKSTYNYWPWLDRISLAIGLRAFTMIIPTPYLAGPAYIGFINILTLILASFWLYRKQGFIAAVLICIFFNTSFFLLGYATYIYPIQTEALFALIAFFLFFVDEESTIHRKRIIFAGIFCAFAMLSKITGAFAAIYFVIYLLRSKEWPGLKDLCAGIFMGIVIVCLLFITLFNVQSFNNTLYSFFRSDQWSGIDYNNLVSYLDQLLSVKFFPIFISLFICTSAYKETMSRRLFCFSWTSIAVIYFIYTFTHRGGSVIPTYIYSAYIFAGIGLAFILGGVFTEPDIQSLKKTIYENYLKISASILSLLFICAGLLIGIKYPAVKKFDSGYLFYKPFDIFISGNISTPEIFRWLFTLGPILVLVILLLFQIKKSKKIVVLFMLAVSLWGAAFNGGLAYQKAGFDRFRAGFFYEVTPVLNEVPDKKFSIFVQEWNKHPKAEEVLWVYREFFNKKFPTGDAYDSELKLDLLIRKSIKYIKDKKYLATIEEKQILTDDLFTINKCFQDVKIVKEIDWRGTKLYVVDVNLPEPSLRLDFKDWNGPNVIGDRELNKVSPYLEIGGIRGSFKCSRILGNENVLKLTPEKPNRGGKLLIQLSLAKDATMKIIGNSKKNIIVSVDVRMPAQSTRSEVFVQDKTTDWNREKIEITNDTMWKRYRLHKRIRDNSSDISMGIFWNPVHKNDYLEIKNIQVYAW